jgi:hypothetical protein
MWDRVSHPVAAPRAALFRSLSAYRLGLLSAKPGGAGRGGPSEIRPHREQWRELSRARHLLPTFRILRTAGKAGNSAAFPGFQ